MNKWRETIVTATLVAAFATGCVPASDNSSPPTPPDEPQTTTPEEISPPPAEPSTAAPVEPIEEPAESSPSPAPATAEPAADGGDVVDPREIAQTYTSATVHLFTEAGSGTGFVIDAAEGIVVTNSHVVSGAGTLKAGLSSGQQVSAKILGSAPCEDLAVVQLNEVPSVITEVILGSAEGLVSQDEVTAIGFPSAFGDATSQSAVTSSGAIQSPNVSAEPDSSLPRYPSLIQHDAAINPGNSGGPLFNDRGEVVGINTLANTISNNRIIQGQYYAITIDRALQFIDTLRAGQSISDIGLSALALSAIDISTVYEDGANIQNQLLSNNLDGLIVDAVAPNGPAEEAQIFPADFITKVNGVPTSSFAQLCDVLASATGDSLSVEGLYLQNTENYNLFDSWEVDVILPE